MTSPLRVLHLEDDVRDAELIRAALESEGVACDVTRVETREGFLAALGQAVDVILADHRLPDFDGLAALEAATDACPHVPFLFVSGTLGEEVAIDALKHGATDYVLKERLSRLAPSVRRALREARERGDRERAEAMLAGEKRALEMIATGAALPAVLDTLCRLVEELSPGSLASILLVDPEARRLRHGAAPSLPPSYVAAIDGIAIGPAAGSCGTAAHRNAPVIVADIAADPLWATWRDLALPHGLRACWSTPVRASDGRVVATVAVYAREPASPTPLQRTVIDQITDLASIAIERKAADDARQAHLWFLESMDRVNRAIQGTNDLERMLSDVLATVLEVFACDRTWLVSPCDPDGPSWRVVMEHTRPEFPGAFALDVDMPVDEDTAEGFRFARASSTPVRFDLDSPHAVPAQVARRFQIRSMLAMVIHPKGDAPYMLGLHQCSSARTWTPSEEWLFQQIGRRLEDALTSVLVFRNLRQSEGRLEEAQRIAHVGYWEQDLVTDIATGSEETLRIFGFPASARPIPFREVEDRIHPDDRERPAAAARESSHGGRRHDVEFRVILPDGEVRFVQSRGDVLHDASGQPRRLFGTVQDITTRKLAEQRLVAQHAVTQILATAGTLEEASPNILQAVCERLDWDVGGLWRVDRDAGVLRCVEVWHTPRAVVPEFEAATRQGTFPPGAGLPGRVWSRREPVYIADVVRDLSFARAPIAAREMLHAAFAVPIRLGGDVLGVIEFFSHQIRRPDQDLLDMMAVIGSQIGQFVERKRVEEALIRAGADLAHVARVAALGELTASIAHEINQPLAAVVNNATACVNFLDARRFEDARECAEVAIVDGHRAAEIIDRIRALAKNDPPRRDAVDVNAIILEVVALLRSEVHRHGISLDTRLADPLPPVAGDRVQLQQVVLNLLMNAIEAMSGNGSAPRHVSIASMPADGRAVQVSVTDSGSGLSPSIRERLFQAFHTTKPHGMGMGLAISRSIVEAHGGRLWATPNEPRGAVFAFTLPIVPR